MSKICFTDFDGVLNNYSWFTPRNSTKKWHLDEDLIQNLNKITTATDSKIVLSTSWRTMYPFHDIVQALEDHGCLADVIGKTPDLSGTNANGPFWAPRGNEIALWLKDHSEVTNMVILDDEMDMEPLMDYHVHTSFNDGLTLAKVEEAIKMLAKPLILHSAL